MRFTIAPPPEITQNTETYLVALRDYLYQMADAINAAGNALDAENFTTDGLETISSTATQNRTELARVQEEAATLRALIIKTADYVESEIETITQTLEANYVAQSEFGEYKDSVTRQITDTAYSTVEEFSRSETITNLQEDSATFSAYMQETQGKIQIGFIETEPGVYRTGVAIGERIDTTTVSIEGEDETVLSSPDMLATFTADELAFYQNGTKLAWFSANQLYVSSLQVVGDINHGDWLITSDSDGWTLKYIGA